MLRKIKQVFYVVLLLVISSSFVFSQINSEAFKIKQLNIKSIDYLEFNYGNVSIDFDQEGRIMKLTSSLNEDREEFFYDSVGNNIAYYSFRRLRT